MKINIKKSARRLAGVLAASAVCASASAIDFTFSQGGFAEFDALNGGLIPVDGSVLGSFSGIDKNGDGFLNFFDSEISAFSLLFTGNSAFGSFSLGLSDLEGLLFKLGGDEIIGNDQDLAGEFEGLAAYEETTDNFFYAGASFSFALGEVGNSASGPWYESSENASATEHVPDAGSTAALLGGAMLGLFGLGRRFRAKR